MTEALCWTLSETLKEYIFVRYILGFKEKKLNLKYLVFTFPLLVLFPSFVFGFSGLVYLKFAWKILFMICFFDGKIVCKLFGLMVGEILILVMDVTNAYLVVSLLYGGEGIYGYGYKWYEFIPIIALVISAVLVGERRKEIYRLIDNVDSVYIIIIMSMIIIATFNLVSLELLKNYSDNNRVRCFSTVIYICSTLGTIIISLMSIYIKGNKDRAIFERRQADELVKIEREHYNILSKREDSLRKIRHDIKGIISALNILISDGKLNEAREYIAKLKDYYELDSKVNTGNRIADTLLDELTDHFKNNNDVKVSVNGEFPSNIDLDDFYLSIILSNALKNAREAIERIENGDRFIDVEILNTKGIMFFTIRNSSEEMPGSRSKRVGHGLGTGIIKEIAEKDGSTVSWDYYNKEVIFTWEKQIQ